MKFMNVSGGVPRLKVKVCVISLGMLCIGPNYVV